MPEIWAFFFFFLQNTLKNAQIADFYLLDKLKIMVYNGWRKGGNLHE